MLKEGNIVPQGSRRGKKRGKVSAGEFYDLPSIREESNGVSEHDE